MASIKTIIEKSRNISREEKFIGSSVHAGKLYHDLPFFEATKGLKSHRRGTIVRANFLSNLVKKNKYKNGIDIGCANGGMTFGLQLNGINMTGVDQDPYVIDFVNEVENLYETGAKFICEDFDYESLLKLNKKYDFAILFSCWQWMAKTYGLENATLFLSDLSRMVNSLYLEIGLTSGENHPVLEKAGIKDEKTFPQYVIANTFFSKHIKHEKINDGWFPRSIYTFSDPVLIKNTKNAKLDFSNIGKVKKTLKNDGIFYKYMENFLNSNKMASVLSKNSCHFPEITIQSDNVIVMEDMGVRLTIGNLPEDWEKQIVEIIEELKKHDLVHRDIHGQNLLVKNGILGICDFDNICEKEEAHKKAMVPGLGACNPEHGFDDEYSIRKTIEKDILKK